MTSVPDPSPQARARAAQNWAPYPNASDGVSLPPLVPDAIKLLKARMMVDLSSQYTVKQRVAIVVFVVTAVAAGISLKVGADSTAIIIVGIVWAAIMALLPVGLAVNRRYNAKYAALLRAAGFTPATDQSGRLRYVPPGGQLPGHGNPFARGA